MVVAWFGHCDSKGGGGVIVVTVPVKDGTDEFKFDTNACEIIDGALVIHEERGGQFHPMSGFAPGAWITFEVHADAD